jgi:predicted transcriptional regulator
MVDFEITDEDEEAEQFEGELKEEADVEELEEAIKEEINESDRDYETREVMVLDDGQIGARTSWECYHFRSCRVVCEVMR